MGYRPKIDNSPVNDPELSLMKKIFYEKFELKVKCVFKIVKSNLKTIYRVNLESGTNIRLDIFSKKKKVPHREFLYQKLAYENHINVAKIIGVLKVENKIWKISEWIEGVRIGDVWNLLKMFKKCGEQIAKLSLMKDPKSGNCLWLNDFNKINLIWTKEEEVYLIYFYVRPRANIDESIVETVLRGIRTKEKIKIFLEGYSKYRDVTNIIKKLDEKNWKGKVDTMRW